MKAYCDRDKVIELLDGRSVKWLVERINDMGIKVEYRAFLFNLESKGDIKLKYALAISSVLNVSVEEIFYLQ